LGEDEPFKEARSSKTISKKLSRTHRKEVKEWVWVVCSATLSETNTGKNAVFQKMEEGEGGASGLIKSAGYKGEGNLPRVVRDKRGQERKRRPDHGGESGLTAVIDHRVYTGKKQARTFGTTVNRCRAEREMRQFYGGRVNVRGNLSS